MDRKLSFNLHIDITISRANRLLGFIYRSTRMFTNIRCMTILYVSIVRPILEYCSVIWSPSYVTHINRIEGIQRKFVRALCFKCGLEYSSQGYEGLLSYFSLPKLVGRRNYGDVMFLFRVLNHFIKCSELYNLVELHVPSGYLLRRTPLVNVNYHRTNYGMHSPLVRISNTVNSMNWNADIFTQNMAHFKACLRRHFFL